MDIVGLVEQLKEQGKRVTHLLFVDMKLFPKDPIDQEASRRALWHFQQTRDHLLERLDKTKCVATLGKSDHEADVTWHAAPRRPADLAPAVFYTDSFYNDYAVRAVTRSAIVKLRNEVVDELRVRAGDMVEMSVQFMVQRVVGMSVVGIDSIGDGCKFL